LNYVKTFRACGLAPLGRSGLRLASFNSSGRFHGSLSFAGKRAARDLNRSQRFLLASLRGLPLAGLKSPAGTSIRANGVSAVHRSRAKRGRPAVALDGER